MDLFSRATAVVLAVVCFALLPPTTRAFTRGEHTHSDRPDFDRRRQTPRPAPRTPAAREAALKKLHQLQPDIRIEFDGLRRSPKYVAANRGFLTGPGGEGRALPAGRAQRFAAAEPRAVKAFLAEHAGLFGHGPEILDGAIVKRDFVAKHNGLRTVVWEQLLDGIAVDDGVLIGHETARGELVSISSLMMPEASQAAERGTPNRRVAQVDPTYPAAQAVVTAAGEIGEAVQLTDLIALNARPDGLALRQSFRAGALPGETRARLLWLPMDEASLRLCWAVEITRRAGGERFRVLVDASTGEVIVRQRQTIYLSEASYRVFTGDSPTAFSPGWSSPNSNQPPTVARSLITFSALSTNASPLGWIADAENETRGNNVDAHTDVNADNFPDLPRPQGVPFRIFDPALDLNQAPAASTDAAVVQLFYWCNWVHDRLYDLGFVEEVGNFQKDNVGRGGLGGDAIMADALDGSGVNNANFTPTPDGEPGRIQMFVWTGSNPDRDGDFDAEVVIHEYVHGLSTRLVGGGVGISTLQAAGLGEGWSDFYALTLLSEPGDDLDGIYPFGAYASRQLAGLAENYYFGIRQYPYATDLSRNPLTFKDIDALQVSPHDGVPRSPINPFNPINASEVHAQGEVWCATLWEARANLIRKHGYSTGNQLILQLVTDGMKLSPPNPDFLQARDAILLADQVNQGGANYTELWRAFAKRGLGFGARGPDSTTTVGVSEAFDLPDSLSLLSPHGFFASGPMGGPIAPACHSFPLTNLSAQPLRWVALTAAPWLQMTPAGGTLAPGQAVTVTACIVSNANELPIGSYADSIVFANLETGITQARPVELRVLIFRELPFVESFEAGEVEDSWSITGTGRHRARVSDLNGPHAGRYHLILDADGGVRSRNEMTLGLDLAGYTNVVLRFWARSFGDEPDSPPQGPIVGGADFDGVAISDDGVVWHEVRSLRSLPSEYTELVIDLDAAIATLGLRYTSGFRIRFNQVDDFQVPFDGIAVDDIRITGLPARRFEVTVPARANEGSGSLGELGRVQLGVPVTHDLIVSLNSSPPGRAAVPATVTIPAGSNAAAFVVTIPDNSQLDGTDRVLITASAAGYAEGGATLEVFDNEAATLRLSLPPRAREGDGLLKHQGVVRSSGRPTRDVSITLTSSAPGTVRVPRSVLLPAGIKDAEFDLTILDDGRIEGARAVTITARVENWGSGSDEILILENDTPALSFQLPPAVSEGNGALSNAAVVRLSGLLPTNLVVSLASSDSTELRVPPTLVIPAGQIQAAFDLIVVDDESVDGRQTVRLTARAAGFDAGAGELAVLDDETPPTPYQPRPANGATNVPISLALEWGTGLGELMINGGFETGDFTGWTHMNSGYGAWYLNDGKFDPEGPDGPAAPLAGAYNAMTAQNGAGWHVLRQDVFIPADAQSATLSWTDRIRNHASYFSFPNQEFRVEVRNTNDLVLAIPFRTNPSQTNFSPITRRTFDLSQFRGQDIRVAFVQQDNLGYLNVAVDDVSVRLGEPVTMTEFDVYFGRSPNLTAAELQGTTTNGFWPLPRLALNSVYFWQVAARRGNEMARGPVWRFTTRGIGDIDHFELGPVASPQFTGQHFAVSVTARDDIQNTAKTFAGPARMIGAAGTGTRSRIVITEIDVPNDAVEFANTSTDELNLSGWTIALYDAVSWPLALTTVRLPDGTRCRPGAHFVLKGPGDKGGEFPVFNAGTNFSWSTLAIGNPIAVLLRDAAGAVVDLVAAGDAATDRMISPQPISTGDWSGPPALVTGILNSEFTLQRVGHADSDSAADWEVATSTTGLRNPGLVLPFPRRGLIPLVPDRLTSFSAGVWEGFVTIEQPVDSMVLEVTDDNGHFGVSHPFTVGARNDVSVSVTASPSVVILGNPLGYEVIVTNTGPTVAAGVVLTNWLAPEVRFVAASTIKGACSNLESMVVCALGDVSPGDSARVVLEVDTLEAGSAIHRAAVSRSGPDAFPANNETVVRTTIAGPLIVALGLALSEGSSSTNFARFPILLSAPCRLPVSLHFATSNMTAQAGLDYVQTSGTLVFPPGLTNLTVTVPIVPDRMDEGLEQFALVLDAAVNGVVANTPPRCRIQDDDPPPMLTVSDATAVEGAFGITTEAEFRFALSAPSALGVEVTYATADNSARAPLDYKAVAGVLRFPLGTTNQSVRVPIRGDNRYEEGETFVLNLSQGEASILVRTQAVARIFDDDKDEVDAFFWSQVPSPQYAGFSFAATLTARDGLGQVATNFAGRVGLTAVAEGREIAAGAGTNGWAVPMGTFFHDLRAQVLYPPEALGGAGSLNAITFDVINAPGQTMSNWTVRLKHTPARSQGAAGWERDGWTTVYQRDESILEAGLVTFFLESPFAYDGTNSLLIDFSFNNATYSMDGLIRSTETETTQTLYLQTDSAFGDPLTWVGTTPPPLMEARVPNLRFQFERQLSVTPTAPLEFAAGIWTGPVTVEEPGTKVLLRSNDGLGRTANSNPFEVLSGRDDNGDGVPDAWELAHFGATGTAAGGAGADPDGDGLSNANEFRAGADPQQPGSTASIAAIELNEGKLRLRFGTVPGRRYWIEQRDIENRNEWRDVRGPMTGEGREVTVTLPVEVGGLGRFFRVRVAP